jgi:uncharacterized Tic20 family protein
MSEIEQAEAPSKKDECVIAMLAYVLMIFSWSWAPLIIYFAKRDSRFVAFHALQALYWQLIAVFASVLTTVVFFVVTFSVTFAPAAAHNPDKMPMTLLLLFPLLWGEGVATWRDGVI